MAETIRIACVQMDVVIGEVEKNLVKIEQSLETAAQNGAKLTVFPECATTGYCFDSLEEAMPFAETIPGRATRRLADVCQRLDAMTVFGMLEADGERLFNACVLMGPGGVLGSYRKIHLPGLGIDRFVTPGDRPFSVVDAGSMRIGMNICYDGSFPESSRIMALDGADLVVLPTNWPPGARMFAEHVINTRAMENGVYYAAANRVGEERGFPFIGKSRICDPDGANLADAPHEEETILYADIDVSQARDKHRVRVPGKHEIDRFADRRPDMYRTISNDL